MKCGTGTYSASSSNKTNQCTNCPTGQYQPNKGKTSCIDCPVGHYQNLVGQYRCLPCPRGTSSNTTGQSNCPTCLANQFQDRRGQISCSPCSPGTNRPGGISQLSSPFGCSTNQCTCSGGTAATGTLCPSHGASKCVNCNSTHFKHNNQCINKSTATSCNDTYIVGTTSTCKPLCELPSDKQKIGGKLIYTDNSIGYTIELPDTINLRHKIYSGGRLTDLNKDHIILDDLKSKGKIKIKDGWWRKDQSGFDVACPSQAPRKITITKGTIEKCIPYESVEASKTPIYRGCKDYKTPKECSRYVILKSNSLPKTTPNKTDYSLLIKKRFEICSTPNKGFILDNEGVNVFQNEHNTFQWSSSSRKWSGS